MEFMEMLREWLDLRDANSFDREDTRPIHKRSTDRARMDELEQEINKRIRGPGNPPRLRKLGESIEEYRVAMGWSNKTPNDQGNGPRQAQLAEGPR